MTHTSPPIDEGHLQSVRGERRARSRSTGRGGRSGRRAGRRRGRSRSWPASRPTPGWMRYRSNRCRKTIVEPSREIAGNTVESSANRVTWRFCFVRESCSQMLKQPPWALREVHLAVAAPHRPARVELARRHAGERLRLAVEGPELGALRAGVPLPPPLRPLAVEEDRLAVGRQRAVLGVVVEEQLRGRPPVRVVPAADDLNPVVVPPAPPVVPLGADQPTLTVRQPLVQGEAGGPLVVCGPGGVECHLLGRPTGRRHNEHLRRPHRAR